MLSFTAESQRLITLFIALLVLQLSACVSISSVSIPVKKSEQIFTPTQLKADLQFLDNSLRQIHPAPFARLNVEKYQSLYRQLYQDLSWPQRRSDFYRLVAPLMSQFADIHTRVLYPQQEYYQFLEQHGKFPLAVLYAKNELIVVADQQQPAVVPAGAKLLSINNISVESILEKFARFVPTETKSGQRRMIQIEFSRLLWSVYQIETDYQVEYLWRGKVFHKTLKGAKQKIATQQGEIVSHYGTIAINDNTTLLWLNDFNEHYDQYDKYLNELFTRIAGQQNNLILDLRYNYGGIIDNLALLLAYLTDKPIYWATEATLKLSEPFRKQHSLLLENAKQQKYGNYLRWLPVEYFNTVQWEILLADDGELLESKVSPVISEKKNHFTGNIFILSNGYCFSACASLVATLQQDKRAIVIGEPPGSLTQIQYGYPVEVKLPNTGLKLLIPAMKFILQDEVNNVSGYILPEYQVERARDDVLSGRDPVFDFALELSKAQ